MPVRWRRHGLINDAGIPEPKSVDKKMSVLFLYSKGKGLISKTKYYG